MSRKTIKKKAEKEPVKSRHIKYLLYEDNPLHMEVVDKIKDDGFPYIGIRHHIVDLDGNDVISDSGKPHFHIYQEFENPVYPAALAKRYGLLDDSGKVDVQFCRCCTGRFVEALCYLTHLNAPEKELYSETDLFGWSKLLSDYRIAALCYMDKHVDIRTALYAMLDWIESDWAGKVITSKDVIKWLLRTPYIRFRNERLFHNAIDEHNQEIFRKEARDRIEAYSYGQIQFNKAVGLEGSFGPEDLGHE